MRNVKKIKVMRLSLLVTILSLGLMTMSCSADEVVADEVVDCECGTVVDKFKISTLYGTDVRYSIKIETNCTEDPITTDWVELWQYNSTNIGDYYCK